MDPWHPLAPPEQLACYAPRLKVEVAVRYMLTNPWGPEAWQEVRKHISWLLVERERMQRAGWFN